MRKYLSIVGAVILGLSLGFLFQPLFSGDNIFQQVKKFQTVLSTAVANYVEPVDSQTLVEAAIKGLLNELDVHSVYIDAEDMKKVTEEFQGSFDGIGVEFDIINDTITIISPIPGGPSESLGIQAGDQIILIDGKDAVGLSRDDVPKKLKGPKGTIVEVDIKRSGENKLIHYAITRDKIPILTVDAAYIIDGTDIGVVEVNRFAATTFSEMTDSLRSLKKQGMKKLILDLRGNPGGYLNQAFMVAEQFLPGGDTIVYTKGRIANSDETFVAKGNGEFEKIPLIVLVDGGSASASEIVTGSIQDQDRGLVVGETSFGKGLVQRQYELDDGSAFRLTIAKYYTPTGRCIQRPYKDKEKYRHYVGRFEPKEGSYIFNAIDKIKEQVDSINLTITKPSDKLLIDSLPIYKTRAGRFVFGGGGITPDFIVKYDTLTNLSAQIRRKNLFNEFTHDYMNSKGKQIKAKYENNFLDFYRNWHVNSDMLEEFKKIAEKKEIKWDDKQFSVDKDFIENYIKASIAHIIWDRNRFLQIYSSLDKQINKAKELFPDAIRIANLK